MGSTLQGSVPTHRAQLSPITLATTRLTYDGRVRECVHNSTVESRQVSWCRALKLRQSDSVIVRDDCYLAFGTAVEGLLFWLKATRQSTMPFTLRRDAENSKRLLRTAHEMGYTLRMTVRCSHTTASSLWTQSTSPHSCVQNKHVKILHSCRFLYLCSAQTTTIKPTGLARI